MTQFLAIRSAASGPPLTGTNQGDVPLWDVATQKWYTGAPSSGGAVSSVFSRVGAVVAVTGDYDSDQVDNLSGVPGVSVSDALDYLLANAGAVDSVFGRVGAVVATAGDYDSDQVDNVSGVTGATVSDALDALAAADAALLSPPIVTYTASQVAQLSDAGKHVLMNVGAGNTYTVPLNATVAFATGTLIVVEQYGAGVTQLVAAGGVTLRYPPSYDTNLNFSERYQQATLKKIGTDEWTLIGGLVLL